MKLSKKNNRNIKVFIKETNSWAYYSRSSVFQQDDTSYHQDQSIKQGWSNIRMNYPHSPTNSPYSIVHVWDALKRAERPATLFAKCTATDGAATASVNRLQHATCSVLRRICSSTPKSLDCPRSWIKQVFLILSFTSIQLPITLLIYASAWCLWSFTHLLYFPNVALQSRSKFLPPLI